MIVYRNNLREEILRIETFLIFILSELTHVILEIGYLILYYP